MVKCVEKIENKANELLKNNYLYENPVRVVAWDITSKLYIYNERINYET